jgi:hypothetical protein
MIADSNNLFASIEAAVLIWGTSRIVNDHRWGTALDYVYGDVVCPGECQDLWLSAPDAGITYGSTVESELLRGDEPGICCADPVFAIYRW